MCVNAVQLESPFFWSVGALLHRSFSTANLQVDLTPSELLHQVMLLNGYKLPNLYHLTPSSIAGSPRDLKPHYHDIEMLITFPPAGKHSMKPFSVNEAIFVPISHVKSS